MDAEAQAIEEIFAGRYQELVGRARAIVRSEADAEDAVQDAMLSLVTAPHVLSTVEQIGAWLITVVRRRCVDIIRRDSTRRDHEAASGLEDLFEGADPSELVESERFARALAREVEALPGDLRTAFVENALDGLTFERMSERSGVPMGTLMARKKKAVDTIREKLGRQGLLPPPGKEMP